jgi:hypothetical protein
MFTKEPFSRRNRFNTPKEITVREDAPANLRCFVVDAARQLSYTPSHLRDVLCRVLHTRPDPGNSSEYPEIWEEVKELIQGCEWFKVYDIIEALLVSFHRKGDDESSAIYTEAISVFFLEQGIGWQLIDGQIETRGAEVFEAVVRVATKALEASARPTAATHLHESLQDLSRRPQPDLPGAIYHAMGALECVARDLTGDEKATLGEIVKRYQGLVPKPLDEGISKVWGYASEEARHVSEGRVPSREEAELVVGLSAAVAGYLTQKTGK